MWWSRSAVQRETQLTKSTFPSATYIFLCDGIITLSAKSRSMQVGRGRLGEQKRSKGLSAFYEDRQLGNCCVKKQSVSSLSLRTASTKTKGKCPVIDSAYFCAIHVSQVLEGLRCIWSDYASRCNNLWLSSVLQSHVSSKIFWGSAWLSLKLTSFSG